MQFKFFCSSCESLVDICSYRVISHQKILHFLFVHVHTKIFQMVKHQKSRCCHLPHIPPIYNLELIEQRLEDHVHSV